MKMMQRKMVDAVFDYYSEHASMGDKLGPFIDRIGLDVFKAGVMALYNEMEKANE